MTLRADIKFQIINNGCYSQITILPLGKKRFLPTKIYFERKTSMGLPYLRV